MVPEVAVNSLKVPGCSKCCCQSALEYGNRRNDAWKVVFGISLETFAIAPETLVIALETFAIAPETFAIAP